MIVRLTAAQVSMANHVAGMRRISNLWRGLRQKHGLPQTEQGWEIDINGCCAEVAVALHLNLFWCGTVNNFEARDVGGMLDVRWTKYDNGRLRLHPEDTDDVPYVLVTGQPPVFHLRGWLFARDGKRQQWWCDPTGKGRPAFFVPQDEIEKDIERLSAWCDVMRRSVTLGAAA